MPESISFIVCPNSFIGAGETDQLEPWSAHKQKDLNLILALMGKARFGGRCL